MVDFFYNLSNLTKINNTLVDVARYTNEVTGGMFWFMTVFIFWAIMFVGMLPYGEKRALLSSTFVATIYSYLLAAMGLMDMSLSIIPTIILVFMVFINMLQSGSN